jgi:alpha-beta hydrolase superfamily lysophospholipase
MLATLKETLTIAARAAQNQGSFAGSYNRTSPKFWGLYNSDPTMSQPSTFTLTEPDGVDLFVYCWLPSEPKAVVQIAHGLAEHAGRYARLADALTSAGYAVYANDHRGHGRTVKAADDLGFFAERDGWRKCVDDLWQLNRHVAAAHPGLPIVLLGHSMGSTLGEQFMGDPDRGNAPGAPSFAVFGKGGK